MTTAENQQDELAKLAELVKGGRVGVLTTVDANGHLVSRPLAMQDVDFTGELWFFTPDPSPKVEDITGNNQVNFAFESGNGWVSVSGTATVTHDRAKIDELWNRYAEAWFADGKDDPTVALIRLDAHTAEYWATDEPKPVIMLKVAKAAVTGGTPDIGENKTVSL